MSDSSLLRSVAAADHITVERALSEARSGRPVAIRDGGEAVLVIGVEALDPDIAKGLDSLATGSARLVLPAARLRRLGLERMQPGFIALPRIDVERIEALALRIAPKLDAPVHAAGTLDLAALELARLALVLPAVVVVPVDPASLPVALLSVEADAIGRQRQAEARALRIVGRAPVPLDGARDTEFVVFRGGEGLRDQVAVIVGKPDLGGVVPVRLHSACLTGDLFGSLKCDCGDQLRGTVKSMAEGGGGIVLYLDQEGRGNGIANKMRAYRLQADGYDTYDADEILGFDLDQRRFGFAAEMLKKLGVQKVALLTNNPVKIAALEDAGLDVVEHRRVVGRTTTENVHYLSSKRDRAGHFIDLDEGLARLPAQD
jgi:GTP cyclohydrolase II